MVSAEKGRAAMRLDGKVTLITGVSQYMGPAFTKVSLTPAPSSVSGLARWRMRDSMQLMHRRSHSPDPGLVPEEEGYSAC